MGIGIIVDNELDNDKRVLREIEILKESYKNISVLCFAFNKKTYNSPEGVNITRIKISKKYKDILFFLLNLLPVYEWFWASKIKNFIRNNNIDILHAHDLYMAKAARMGINRSGKKVDLIIDLHENFPFAVTTYNWTKGFFRKMISQPQKWAKKEKSYLSLADRIIVLSDEFRDELIDKYPTLKKETFCALPNVPDLVQMGSFNPDLSKIPFQKKAPILFYFGVVAERRGIFDALSAFRKIIEAGNNLDFMIIGPVDKKDVLRFKDIITSGPIVENVIYIPWIDLSELPAYLEICDICIAPFHKNPQHESGVANKIYDYMLGKKPVIATDCKPQKRLIEKYNCGIVYENEAELIEGIISLLKDENKRKEFGLNGYNAIVDEFNTDRIKNRLLKLYSDLE